MGRPRLPESQKQRSFTVGLAPRTTGRKLAILSQARGQPMQEILRAIIVPAIDEMYEAERKRLDLPPVGQIANLEEVEFRRVLTGAKPSQRRRLITKREAAHA